MEVTNNAMLNVAIIDYELGNHQSVYHAIRFLGAKCLITKDFKEIHQADAYILPGVGAFEKGIANLQRLKLDKILHDCVQEDKKPILGICLGMQLFADKSYEYGEHAGLGWVPGRVVPFKEQASLRIPHVGWNNLCSKKKAPLFLKTDADTNFYFDHSYHYDCPQEFISSTFLYPNEIVASIQRDHIFGVQFHPEKSQLSGLRLLRSFLNFVEQREISHA